MSNPNKPQRERDTADLAAELEDVRLAQSGDRTAATRLWLRYRGLIRAHAGKVAKARGLQPADREDLEADLTVALLEAIPKLDTDRGIGLAALLPRVFAGVTNQLNTVIAIPRTTLNRYWAAMKDADGIVDVAADLAPEHGMTRETFINVHQTLRTGTPEDAEATPWDAAGRPAPNELQASQVDLALSVLTDKQRAVIEVMYGFRDGQNHGPDWAGQTLGITKSAAAKFHNAAMKKMRAALAVKEPEAIAA